MSGCGTGGCGCSSTEKSTAAPASTLTPAQTAAYEALVATMGDAPQQATPATQAGALGGMSTAVAEVARVTSRNFERLFARTVAAGSAWSSKNSLE